MKRPIPWIAALATLILHAAGNPHYGYFRDELYFIICGFHPQFGYVDQPPIVPLLAALSELGGHSLFLLRLVPAIFAAGGAYVTALLVLEFGGDAFAQILATVAYIGAPVLIAFGTKVGPDEVGLWLWPLMVLYIVRIAKGADPRLWLAVGAIAGICAESKYTVLFFLLALFVGLVATPERRLLRSPWAIASALLATAITLPNFIWQARHGFPMWTLLEAGQHGKNVIVGPAMYLFQEVVITNLYIAPIWILGVVWLVRTPRVRFAGIAYLVLIAEMIVLHGKHYYPADVYPIAIAAGSVALAGLLPRRPFVRGSVLAYSAVFAALSLPIELPILGQSSLLAYENAVLRPLYPISGAMLATEHGDTPAIGEEYADMNGWPAFTDAARRAYLALPPAVRARTVVLAVNYGEASALRFFAPELPTISPHNQFWLWGYGAVTGDSMLELGGTCWQHEHYFSRATVVAHYVASQPVMGFENHLTFYACSGLRVPLRTLWDHSKNYS